MEISHASAQKKNNAEIIYNYPNSMYLTGISLSCNKIGVVFQSIVDSAVDIPMMLQTDFLYENRVEDY